jgi:glycosyltransferase involved in cell wall biosynthesis
MVYILKPLVSVIIPAFNEEKNIGDTLTRICRVLEMSSLACEVIVIDDGSTDRTREVAYRHKVVVLYNEKNGGKGSALRRGFKNARGDFVVTIDADGAHDPDDILKVIGPVFDGADIVLGSRFANGQGKGSTTTLNFFGNKLINLAIWIMSGKRVTDSQTGFRAYRRKLIEDIGITSEGYEVETELLMKSLGNGNIVREVPISIQNRNNGHSHLNPLLDGFRILQSIIRSGIVS